MSQQELDGLKRTDKGWDEDSTILQQPRLGESVELIANLKQFQDFWCTSTKVFYKYFVNNLRNVWKLSAIYNLNNG